MSPEISRQNLNCMHLLRLSAGQPPYQFDALAVWSGCEWVVTASNNQAANTVVAMARPGQKQGELPMPGRSGTFEQEFVREAALELANQLQATVTFSVGIGFGSTSVEERELALASLRDLLRALVEQMPPKE